jgi:hypothetical protein
MVHRPCPNSRVDIIVNEKILREKRLLDSSYWLEKFHIENFPLVTEHRTSCYWTDWNWANTENIRIGLVFAVLAQ